MQVQIAGAALPVSRRPASRAWCCATARSPRCGPRRRRTATRCGGSSTSCRRSRGGAASSRLAEPPDALIDALLRLERPRAAGHAARAARRSTASCVRSPSGRTSTWATATAEAAFAVDDRVPGQGPRHDAARAARGDRRARTGFARFEATTLPDNAAMLEVFHESGFEIRSKSERGCDRPCSCR